jgi:hypothetical protein
MRVGDLVKWSNTNAVWHLLHSNDLISVRQRGVIIDRNPRYFFVFWENGECVANCFSDLEVVSEG